MIKYGKQIFFFLMIISLALISIICMEKNIEMILIAVLLAIPFMLYCNKNPKRYVYFQLMYNLLIKYLISDFGMPSFANYLTDVITVICVYYAIKKIVKEREKVNFKSQFIIVILMLLLSVLGLIINEQSIMLYIWGFRNIYRFFAFFFASIILLDKTDIVNFIKILKVFLLINVVLCTYQYFIQNLVQDRISGIFGTLFGGNAGMNLFLVIVTTVEVIYYLNNKTSFSNLCFVIIASIYIATISELKIFYIEFVLIVLLAVLINNFNKKTLIIIVGTLCVSIVAIRMLYIIYPTFKNFFNIDRILMYSAEGGYSNEENLNRITAIEQINELYVFNNLETRLFGIGMGNADTSQFSFLNSDFYEKYSYLSYTWFSHAFMYIENGYIGLILYVIFFISIIVKSHRMKYKDNVNKVYYMITELISLMAILIMVYNSSLRMDYAYIYYLFLAMAFVFNKNNNSIQKDYLIKKEEKREG